jgi:2-polyprenyl-6-methoxyphenol hydroxylase-like FAD-dependent oxidoreductase
MKALIIGAGVGGPVAAMALQQAGIDAAVYEARPRSTTNAGSFLTVASNGLDALRAIGAHTTVLAAGFPTADAVLLSGTGKVLATVPIGSPRRQDLVSRTIRRACLQRVLHDEAVRRGVSLEYGRRLVGAEPARRGVVARFDDGSEAAGDVLIGCDGIHSATRRLIDPHAPDPRYVGLLNFGGYTPGVQAGTRGAWHMIFGKRAFFGYTADAEGGTAWFANVPRHPAPADERRSTSSDTWMRWLVDLFAGDRGPAADLISAGTLELAADNTHDLPFVATWHRGPMVVIGDAAHAPSPTSGQGASMAIEDGVVLARCLRDMPVSARAFAAFERARRRRVQRIVAHGARGSSNKAATGAARVLRDLLLPFVFRHVVTPSSVAWMYDHHIDWEAPITVDADEG